MTDTTETVTQRVTVHLDCFSGNLGELPDGRRTAAEASANRERLDVYECNGCGQQFEAA